MIFDLVRGNDIVRFSILYLISLSSSNLIIPPCGADLYSHSSMEAMLQTTMKRLLTLTKAVCLNGIV